VSQSRIKGYLILVLCWLILIKSRKRTTHITADLRRFSFIFNNEKNKLKRTTSITTPAGTPLGSSLRNPRLKQKRLIFKIKGRERVGQKLTV
jgi:hypothetical protein